MHKNIRNHENQLCGNDIVTPLIRSSQKAIVQVNITLLIWKTPYGDVSTLNQARTVYLLDALGSYLHKHIQSI